MSDLPTYCAPRDAQGRPWLLIFDDTDRGIATYETAQEARAAFERAESMGWNCSLFRLAERAPPSADVPREPTFEMLSAGEYEKRRIGAPVNAIIERIWRAMWDAARREGGNG